MARKSSGRKSSRRTGRSIGSLSPRTRKAIDTFPSHAQQIYKKARKNALKQYKTPSKRRGGKRQSREQVAHNKQDTKKKQAAGDRARPACSSLARLPRQFLRSVPGTASSGIARSL
jgi:cation transport regulator ChaB